MTQALPYRHQLARHLKARREQAGLGQQDVASNFGWHVSKLNRIEQGRVRVAIPDLRAMLGLYGVTDPAVIDELSEMARGSKKLPFAELQGVFTDQTARYFALEAAASAIRQFAQSVIPGLLQIEPYTLALCAGFGMEATQAKAVALSRRARQELLRREHPPQFNVVLDEAVLRRSVGGSAVMAAQIERLTAAVEAGQASIQVISFELGAHVGLPGSFNHLEFDNPSAGGVAFAEGPLGDLLIEDKPDRVTAYRDRFTLLTEAGEDLAKFLQR